MAITRPRRGSMPGGNGLSEVGRIVLEKKFPSWQERETVTPASARKARHVEARTFERLFVQDETLQTSEASRKKSARRNTLKGQRNFSKRGIFVSRKCHWLEKASASRERISRGKSFRRISASAEKKRRLMTGRSSSAGQ